MKTYLWNSAFSLRRRPTFIQTFCNIGTIKKQLFPQILSPTLFSFNDWQKDPLTALHNRNHDCRILPMLAKRMWLCSCFFSIATTEGCHFGAHHQCDPSGLDAYYFVMNTKDDDAHTASFSPANIMAQVCIPIWDIVKTVTRHVHYCRTETKVLALHFSTTKHVREQ